MGRGRPKVEGEHGVLPSSVVELQRLISRCSSMTELLSVLGRELGALLPAKDRVSLVFLDSADDQWMRIYRVLPADSAPLGSLPRVRVEGTPVGRVVRDGICALVEDVRTDPNITFGHASHGGIRSTISTPLWVGGRVVGALNAGSKVPGYCDRAMLDQLQQLGTMLGPAIYSVEQSTPLSPGEAGTGDVVEEHSEMHGLVGTSAVFRDLVRSASRAAASDADVLISGETGVGKTALARAIHNWGPRKGGPFVTVHLADLTSSLVESELFGHARGAFTGALSERVGRFESAQGGTIFLDEIGETPLSVQAKLLRVIQDRCLERVGSCRTIDVDVHVIAATSRDLRAAMDAGEFRSDLFYRLNVVPLHVPPLRDRAEDLAPLTRALLARLSADEGRQLTLSDDAWKWLRSYSWPGNIRELEGILRRAVILEGGDVLELEGPEARQQTLASERTSERVSGAADWPTLKQHEKSYIERVLQRCEGVIEGPHGAAHLLNVRPSTLRSRMRRLGVSAGPMRSKAKKGGGHRG